MKRSLRLPVLLSLLLSVLSALTSSGRMSVHRLISDLNTQRTRRVKWRVISLTLAWSMSVLMLTTPSLEVLAQGTSNPRYQTAIKQAKSAASQGKYKEAAEALRRAVSISPQPEIVPTHL